MTDTLNYHERELAIALDPSHPNHLLPPVRPDHHAILDVGCGMGQTLLALNLAPDVTACGIDPDPQAIRTGRTRLPPNVQTVIGRGEDLPYPSSSFDLVFCRVSLPYMHVSRALSEMYRVLQPGGDLWLVLHSARMYARHLSRSVKTMAITEIAFNAFIGVNSLVFNFTGGQWDFHGQSETFQTHAGIRRALSRCGFADVKIFHDHFFVAEARKPA